MRKILATAIIAAALLAAKSQAWTYYIAKGGAGYQGDNLPSTSSSYVYEFQAANGAPSITATLVGPGVYIAADTTNSWVQYEANVNLLTGKRDLIVFRNPQSALVAPLLKQFQDALNAGRKLMYIRNQGLNGVWRQSTPLTSGWEGFAASGQTSYDILPGDMVTFYFR